MEAGRTCGYRDDTLPTLSLGLSSVRLIVNKFESRYTRGIASDTRDRELVKYDPNIDEGYDDYDDSPLERSRGQVWDRFVESLSLAVTRCIPSVSFGNFGVLAVTTGLFAPKMISYLVLYPFCRLVFGTLYPAYASYKAVRTKNLKEYVKWMMYWIVFALFTCTETFTDMFLSWFPFYYEVKIVLVLWLLSPATKGSSILYRKFVHPALCRREQEIDEYIAKAKDQGYHTVLNLGTKGVNYATTVIMQTAIKGGGGLVQQLRKSYSLSDLTECSPREERGNDEADDVLAEPLVLRRAVKAGYVTRRSASESNNRSPIYFPEVDVEVRPRPRSDEPDFSHIKSTEDISSGYSSADNSASLTRTGSLGAGARRTRATRTTTVTTIKRPQAAEESEVIIEELRDDDNNVEYANMPPLVNFPSPIYLSHTEPPFLYQYVGNQVKIIQVLGDFPLGENIKTNTSNQSRENKDKTIETKSIPENSLNEINSNIPANAKAKENKSDRTNTTEITSSKDNSGIDKEQSKEVTKLNESTQIDIAKGHTDARENIDTASLDDVLTNDNDSAESDDEASFGTPDNSPKSKRKSSKGKYGKSKAPLPPNIDNISVNDDKNKTDTDNNVLDSATSQESLVDIVNKLPKAAFKEIGNFKGLQVVNPIAEKKRRHKSKSPGVITKSNSSGLNRLLQLPGKLAFWHKGDDKSTDVSNSSSRRSSNIEQANDEFQSCNDLTNVVLISDVDISDDHQEASDYDTESISQEIIEKSDALQKTIEAKLESHPEYKTGALQDEILSTSKSTDV